MKKIDCIIIEDEPLAAELLDDYIGQIGQLNLVGHFSHAMQALPTLSEQSIDLIFLDLHLPGIKGFEFLKTLSAPPKIIVTTAYHQYALEGYDLGIIDYLLKPIEFARFLKAIDKLNTQAPIKTKKEIPIIVTANRQKQAIIPSSIHLMESQKDYVVFHLYDRTVRSKMTLHSAQELLAMDQFVRIHKSYIVSIDKLESYTKTSVRVKGHNIPIGRSFQAFFQAQIGKWLGT